MPENVQSPVFQTSDITVLASAALVGGRFVKITGNAAEGAIYNATTAGAGENAFGIARYSVASGKRVGVIGTPGRIVKCVAAGTIAANSKVQVGADGKVVVYSSGVIVGTALTAGVTSGSIDIKLA